MCVRSHVCAHLGINLCTTCAGGLRGQNTSRAGGLRCPGDRVIVGCKLPNMCWEWSPCPLRELWVLLTAEGGKAPAPGAGLFRLLSRLTFSSQDCDQHKTNPSCYFQGKQSFYIIPSFVSRLPPTSFFTSSSDYWLCVLEHS